MSPVDLPHGWHAKKIEDIGRVVTGSTPSTIDVENYGQSVPWVSPSDMRSKKYVTLTRNSLSQKGGALARMVPSGSVLVTCIGSSIGKSAIAGRDLCTNQQINSIIVNGDLSGEYVYYAFAFHGVSKLHRLSGTTALPIVPKGLFEKLSLPLPRSKLEQQKIAAILAAVDDKLDVIARQIEATQTLKQGLMQTLFSRGVGTQDADGRWVPHAEFKDSELGKVPLGWSVRQLGSVTQEFRERNSGALDDALLCGVLKEQGLVPMRERVKGASTERCRIVRPNAFAYNPMRINIGSIARNLRDHPVMVSPDYVVFASKAEELMPEYLDHFRRSEIWQRFVGRSGDGGVRIRIYYDDLAQLRLKIPTIAEQTKIIEILDRVSAKLNSLVVKHDSLQKLKRGLMQKLLTGEWRVRLDAEMAA